MRRILFVSVAVCLCFFVAQTTSAHFGMVIPTDSTMMPEDKTVEIGAVIWVRFQKWKNE